MQHDTPRDSKPDLDGAVAHHLALLGVGDIGLMFDYLAKKTSRPAPTDAGSIAEKIDSEYTKLKVLSANVANDTLPPEFMAIYNAAEDKIAAYALWGKFTLSNKAEIFAHAIATRAALDANVRDGVSGIGNLTGMSLYKTARDGLKRQMLAYNQGSNSSLIDVAIDRFQTAIVADMGIDAPWVQGASPAK